MPRDKITKSDISNILTSTKQQIQHLCVLPELFVVCFKSTNFQLIINTCKAEYCLYIAKNDISLNDYVPPQGWKYRNSFDAIMTVCSFIVVAYNFNFFSR